VFGETPRSFEEWFRPDSQGIGLSLYGINWAFTDTQSTEPLQKK